MTIQASYFRKVACVDLTLIISEELLCVSLSIHLWCDTIRVQYLYVTAWYFMYTWCLHVYNVHINYFTKLTFPLLQYRLGGLPLSKHKAGTAPTAPRCWDLRRRQLRDGARLWYVATLVTSRRRTALGPSDLCATRIRRRASHAMAAMVFRKGRMPAFWAESFWPKVNTKKTACGLGVFADCDFSGWVWGWMFDDSDPNINSTVCFLAHWPSTKLFPSMPSAIAGSQSCGGHGQTQGVSQPKALGQQELQDCQDY